MNFLYKSYCPSYLSRSFWANSYESQINLQLFDFLWIFISFFLKIIGRWSIYKHMIRTILSCLGHHYFLNHEYTRTSFVTIQYFFYDGVASFSSPHSYGIDSLFGGCHSKRFKSPFSNAEHFVYLPYQSCNHMSALWSILFVILKWYRMEYIM